MITYNEYKRIDFIDLEKLINKEFGWGINYND
jgi:hypothetical protein